MALDANVIAAGFPVLELDSKSHSPVSFDPCHTGIVLCMDSPCCFSVVDSPSYFSTSSGKEQIKLVTLSDRRALVFANLPLGRDGRDVKFLGCVNITNPDFPTRIVTRVPFWLVDFVQFSDFQVGDVFEWNGKVFEWNGHRVEFKVIEVRTNSYLLQEMKSKYRTFSVSHYEFKNALLLRNAKLLAGPTFDKYALNIARPPRSPAI